MNEEPTLYGLNNSNRNQNDFWSKNCFNSSFPASLACWMRDNDIPAVYIKLDSDSKIINDYIGIGEVFNTSAKNSDIFFEFESSFYGYHKFVYDHVTGIDIIIKEGDRQTRALEVKLTVVPDNTTANSDESLWEPEIVVRPASTQFCALGMLYTNIDRINEIRDIFDPICSSIQHWNNKLEMLSKFNSLVSCLDQFHSAFCDTQQPFLLQPIWKTKGTSTVLADNAFDMFVWSDHALCRAFTKNAVDNFNPSKVTRQSRAVFRLARVLWEVSKGSKTTLSNIYTEMAFDLQTDKEFSFSGKISQKFLLNEARFNPRINKSKLKEIILNGGHKKLSPERRFDATIFYTADGLFSD